MKIFQGYNRKEREAISRSILLRTNFTSLQDSRHHKHFALKVFRQEENAEYLDTKRRPKTSYHRSKTISKKKTSKTQPPRKKSIFSLVDTLIVPRPNTSRIKRFTRNVYETTRTRRRPRPRPLPRAIKTTSISTKQKYSDTQVQRNRKIRTHRRSKHFAGAGFKTRRRLPAGKLMPLSISSRDSCAEAFTALATVEPLTAWSSTS